MPPPGRPSNAAKSVTAPPAAKPAAPAAAPAHEVTVGWLSEHIHKADLPYRVLVVLLGFLLGSFVAGNIDVWTSLATGRLLTEGKYTFGVDPFSYMTEAQAGRRAPVWVNHSWLYAWICYLIYGVDGAVLVVMKALCLAGLALLMLRAGASQRHGWAGTWCVLLALLVVSSQALLQPVVISFLFFAATLLILRMAGFFGGDDAVAQPQRLWVLPVLFAVWGNLDAWFILGPLTLLLCIVTNGAWRLAHREKKPPAVPRPAPLTPRPSLVLAVSLLACLANPHHYRALTTLPPELGYLLLQLGNFWPESFVAGGAAFRFSAAQTVSPISMNFWLNPSDGGNVAGYSFALLLILVAASFYFCRPASTKVLVMRAVPTAFFALLALALAKLTPWFAIIGGLVLMWNVQEFLARRETEKPALTKDHERWANGSRLAMGFALFGLFFLAWPGWVNFAIGDYTSPRRVGWGVEEDVSLKNAAQFLTNQHGQGSLHRGFNSSPDLAAYCAFHAPDLKFFLDQRAGLFDRTMPIYARIRKGLKEETESTPFNVWGGSATISVQGGWRDDLSRNRIDYIAGTDATARELMMWTLRYPVGELETIYADGKTVVIAWNRDFKKGKTFKARGQEITQRWQREAFGPHDGPWPDAIPTGLVSDPGFWGNYLFGQQKTSPAAQEAKMLLDAHDELLKAPPWTPFYVCAWLTSCWTVPAGVAPGPFGLATLPLQILHTGRDGPYAGSDLGCPAALVLSLRIVRHALAEDPEDADCYRLLVLGIGQTETTLEGFWARGEPIGQLRANLRKCQFVSALQQYLLLNPQDLEAHWALGMHFEKQGCWDLAVKHLDQAVKLMAGFTNPAIKEARAQRENHLAEVRQLLDERLREFTLQTAQASDLDKVAVAAFVPYQVEGVGGRKEMYPNMGLQGKAWEILNQLVDRWATLAESEQQRAMKYYVYLGLRLGHLAQVNKIIRSAPGADPIDLLFVSAAESDFHQADEALAARDKILAADEKELQKRAAVGVTAPLTLLLEPTLGPIPAAPVMQLAQARAAEYGAYQATRAEHLLLHGLFALDAGKTLAARRYFEQALRLSEGGSPFPDSKIARRYLQLLDGRSQPLNTDCVITKTTPESAAAP